ncbi:hypothetical protein HETIRDRAFT_61294 [Heterobasidion irregulare TC 32-1]|uniref:Uncharacterized protein n=1 Tax=Heterobasidion irregulare (strain TC 32-1) TaxID=747525 RepID=W4K8R8_HETIT|nr:uncharacterized protein HETIRDRAFT_61294 [Heterobasidion irregulare TC 32-1]ETW82178.1 hypothetical protein HETIRDRAFT_61294 [Heterobasidion irregulare TC 32-1]
MEYDRKSAVSSFYGGRPSGDALNRDYSSPPPTAPPDGRARRDSASSFFNPNAGNTSRPSADVLRGQSAGYNRQSFFDAGRQEPIKGGYNDEEAHGNDAGWDVFADFNNTGPRYSTAFGLGQSEASYHQLPPHGTPSKLDDDLSTVGPVEMVTVPALGPEWKASELRDMTKAGKSEKKAERRSRQWKEFNRGQRGLLGRKWLTRRVCVFIGFGLIVAIGIVLAFTIPRVPGFELNGRTPLQSASGDFNSSIPIQFSRIPTNFSFPAVADLQIDTGSNFLPLTFNSLHATVFDLDSLREVGHGEMGKTTLPAKTFSNIQMPLNFTYTTVNTTDTTWTNWYDACRNKALINGDRPGLRFTLNIAFKIAGLPSQHQTSTSVTNAPCPIELSANAP